MEAVLQKDLDAGPMTCASLLDSGVDVSFVESEEFKKPFEDLCGLLLSLKGAGPAVLTLNALGELHKQLYPLGTPVRQACIAAGSSDTFRHALSALFSRLGRFLASREELTSHFEWGLKRSVALSTLLLFHLNEIHPFCDGNGRLARLVSKLFLDHHCPLPVVIDPRKRGAMLQALTEARSPTLVSPPQPPNLGPLCHLLIECAIETHSPAVAATRPCAEPSLATVVAETGDEAAQIPGGREAWSHMHTGETRRMGGWQLIRL
ncbi:hypothetical protein PAPYR_1801 [Paratrimastix pyriformis]|uniref:Fido domain-containing protein n=1 Tax=Paratrimastix pyriformis TaxID=342808 RepID=A0ABQ8UT27_9EUKA|nr:hypothetical protein PAPYR_1801 [Paratrimastix pyriformis]